jgi:peptidoglycan/LPS O-acetylase OafA/YrhL
MHPDTLLEQFIGNMTLTQMTTPALAYNQLNGALWSIAIEAQFYVLFPLLVKAFRRHPYGVMLAAFLVMIIAPVVYSYLLFKGSGK